MSFAVPADAYDRFMGPYSKHLAPQMADLAGVAIGQLVLDVGCGTGALTGELVRRLGAEAVTAVDPSEQLISAVAERYPGVTVQRASAEHLPFSDDTFDVSLAQLVVHFMKDPVAGLADMARVTRTHGVVAACVWDHGGGHGPLSLFWEAARQLGAKTVDESQLAGVREGHLGELFGAAGLKEIEETSLAIAVEHPSFDDWWEPYTLGVGPAGSYVVSLDSIQRSQLRELAREKLPEPPFVLTAKAWAARGIA